MASGFAAARSLALAVCLLASATGPALAEPYLALRTGLKCSSCHLNRTGGGGRTTYGAGYGRQSLPTWGITTFPDVFDGALSERVRLGADLRGGYQVTFRKGDKNLEEAVLSAAQLYAFVDIVADRFSVYVDERFAPGGTLNREAFLLLRTGRAGLYFKGGQFFLPFGWRLQDDEAAIRKYTGFNFSSTDTGLEIGAEPGRWSLALSLTNGAGGGSETNNGKQVAFNGAYVGNHWRIGVGFSDNNLPLDARKQVAGLNAGFHAGPVVGLGEFDVVRNEPGQGAASADSETSHLELDWLAVRGLTIRAWFGGYDPNRDQPDDRQEQIGLGGDWTVLPGLQVRAFYRYRTGPEAVSGSRDGQALLELHAYF